MPTVLHVRAFRDNYIWLVCSRVRPLVVIVDPGDSAPVLAFLERERLTPAAILCTHHHNDHVDGVAGICERYPVPVYGPAGGRIGMVNRPLNDGDIVQLPDAELAFRALAVPGHTLDHFAYLFDNLLFCGDTLFSAGCGRLFEGTAAQLHDSLRRLRELPDETQVYCGHEYTLANLRFASAVEPANTIITEYRHATEARLAANQPSLPSTLATEKQVNPFLRVDTLPVREAAAHYAGTWLENDVAVFAALRRWKDEFRG
jgi:hydroxyacylglutathione hydrolase